MSIPFVHDFDAPYGQCQVISPRVKRVLADNPSPFSYTGTGSFILGTGPFAILDPGPNDPAHIAAIINALDDGECSAILVTHTHLDHSPAAKPLADKLNVPIYAFGPHGMGKQRALEGEDVEAGADNDFTPTDILKDGDQLCFGDATLTAIHTPGHTSNHVCFHLEEENTCFTGDHIMGWSTTIISPPDGDMADYMASLKKVRDLNPALLRPIHGPAIENPVAFINALIEHREVREEKIYQAVVDGCHTIEQIVPRVYHDIDTSLYPAAARSTLAHIIHLIDQNKIITKDDIGLQAHYIKT